MTALMHDLQGRLLRLLQEVPQILEVATETTLTRLQATNRQLRDLVHSTRSTIHLPPTLQDAAVLATGRWLTLKHLKLCCVSAQHI